MRKFVGFFLLLAGLAFGAFAFYPEVLDRETRLAEVTEIIAAPAGDVSRRAPETTGSLRTFAPNRAMTIESPKLAPQATGETIVAEAKPAEVAAAPRTPAIDPQIPSPQINGWQAIVTPDTGGVPTGVTSSKPGDGHARYELVLNIQRELKRAGCYGGTLSGSWSANTKRAMGSFMERVNATLPIDEPDYILLTLIKGQATASCVTCPLGQSLADGRCIPNAVIAQKKLPKPDERRIESAAKSNGSGFKTTTAIAEADTMSTTVAAAPAAALPGRMSMGGPKVEPPPAVAPVTESWKVKIIPTPAKPAPASNVAEAPTSSTAPNASQPVRQVPAPVLAPPLKTKTAVLLEDDTPAAVVPPVDEPANQVPDGRDRTCGRCAGNGSARVQIRACSPATWRRIARHQVRDDGLCPTLPDPSPHLCGTSSAATCRFPSRARPASRPQRVYTRRSGTRSVQSLFTHPLGRL